VLERLFTCPKLVEFISSFKAVRGGLNLRAEFAHLKTHMIFSETFWKKLTTYVSFTEHMIAGLRKSDTDSPNLYIMYPCFEIALAKCTQIAKNAMENDRSLYVTDFDVRTRAAFERRRKDIVTPLALAAAFVDPKTAYMENPLQVPEGFNSITLVMTKYYKSEADPAAAVASAMTLVTAFREQHGPFFGGSLARTLSQNVNPDVFWAAAVQALGAHGAEVCRFLVNSFAGQGAAERMNKKIKRARTHQRNRQQHIVTSAYVELNMHIHGADSKKRAPKGYLFHRKDEIDELRAILAAEAQDAREAAAAADALAATSAGATVNGAAGGQSDQDGHDEDEDDDGDEEEDEQVLAVLQNENTSLVDEE
jgi:hypothetical protein